MAASKTKTIHVDYQSSDSGSEGDLEHSDDSHEGGESFDEEGSESIDEGGESIDEEEGESIDEEGGESIDEEGDESIDEGGESIDEDADADTHSGLANVMAKILQKKVPIHKQVILTKGQKRKVTEDGDEKPAEGSLPRHEKVKVWENMNRVKPDPRERNTERQFQRIATRGVVQLFNAVRKQQSIVKEEVGQVGSSSRKRDKVMEGMTKDKFLTILKGATSSNVKIEKPATKVKTEPVDDVDEEKWNILRDDYMMGARMKDWNKDSSGDEAQQQPDMSDSD